jgi:hypothetical protein
LELLEPLKIMKNLMSNSTESLLLLNYLYWEERVKRKRRTIALQKELSTDTLLLNSILLATMQSIKMDLFKELKNSANKKAAKKKESLWPLIGIDITVESVG